jgi:phosphopantetheinyl transferase
LVDTLLPSTFRTKISLKQNNNEWIGGLCIANQLLMDLHNIQELFFDDNDKEYYNSLIYEKRRSSFLLGRYCSKHSAAVFNNLLLTEISIQIGIFQQPVIHCPTQHNLQISLSHSDTIGFAITFPEKCPIGVDVEKICSTKTEAMISQMTIEEMSLPLILDSRNKQLTLLWTVKEALSKVLRCGIMMPFHILEIESIVYSKNIIRGHFKNFPQYHATSFVLDNYIFSIVSPKNIELNILDFNLDNIQKILNIG